ncbi:hypothetical protein R1sor_006568 [Riccia sorocarpa]|uniref:Sodium/metabolite cotransporter BASS1, chloroplastic n=1 Tax=Riccia sorocarpa TaxID=122646 RepID=A0ABD3HQT4_9MARC
MELAVVRIPCVRFRAFPTPVHVRSRNFQGRRLAEPGGSNLILRTGRGINQFVVKPSGLIVRGHAPSSSSPAFGQTVLPPSGRIRRGNRLFDHSGVNAAVPDDGGEKELEPTVELQGWERKAERIGEVLSSAFPLWVALACVVALIWPAATGWIDQRVQVFGITVTMLGMGMTLTLKDFQGACLMPRELLAGVLLQYTVMPASGYFVGRWLQLPPHYAAGLILVACCPGGTASNIVTYLARGNVALSVLMTAASTFLAVVMTPVLTAKLVGQFIAVDAASLFLSTVQVVLLPVVGGAVMNYFFKNAVKKIALLAPSVAVFMVAIVCAGAVGRSAAAILSSGGQIVLAVCALHSCGFAGGYILSKLLRLDESSCRTISIEVGMQNSVLGVVLAAKHFSNPLTAVPCAVSSVCHSIFGSTLAGFWRLRPTNVNDEDKDTKKVLSS